MFELSYLFFFSALLFLSLPLFFNPVAMVGVLMGMSLSVVGIIALFSSYWYSYILFLIYVGALLVLFIYICLVSSNNPMKVNHSSLVVLFILSSMGSLMGEGPKPMGVSGSSGQTTGMTLIEGSNISIFLFLVVLLLIVLLIVVRVTGTGAAVVVNESY